MAQHEARALGHDWIGTEHILLGLLREEQGVAARVLESRDVSLEKVRAHVIRVVGQDDEVVTTGQIPFTPRAKQALEFALQEALSLGHEYIGTEHVLLGLTRVNDGVASRIWVDLGTDPEIVRREVVRMLSAPRRHPSAGQSQVSVVAGPMQMYPRAREGQIPAIAKPSLSPAAILQRTLPLVVAAIGFPIGLLVGWLIWG